MPKISNKGFASLPILAISVLSLSVLSFLGYKYLYEKLDNSNALSMDTETESSEDVLQAASKNVSKDLNTFFFRNILDSENLSAFNKGSDPLILSTAQDLSNCIFSQRSSKPLNVNYSIQGKKYTVSIFQGVTLQVLPRSISSKKYALFSPQKNAPIVFSKDINAVRADCGPASNYYIIEQPATPITTQNFNTIISTDSPISGGSSPSGDKPNSSIEYNADIVIIPNDKQTILRVTPKSGNPQANSLIHDYFKNRGIRVTLDNGRTYLVKETSCITRNCAEGFTMKIDQKVLFLNGTLKAISFPFVNNKAQYNIDAQGQPCPTAPRQLFEFKSYTVLFNFVGSCPIGMNYQN